MRFVVVAFAVAGYLIAPTLVTIGWMRWVRHPQERRALPVLSLVSFMLGTASAVLAIGSLIYAFAIGGFPYYDPRLMRIYAIGSLLSLIGLMIAIAGVWRRSTLRWYAPALSFWMLLIWFSWAIGE